MSKEDFNYRGYLLDLGYEENEIPAEFTDEEKDQLYAQAIQGTYNAYLEQEKNLDPNASKKERVIAATKRMIDDIPEAREALGIPEEITDQQEPYDLVKFADFVASTSPGETNFDEPVQNYLESYSKTLYNDMTPLVRSFLQNVEKREFKKHFMEANGIDKDTTVNDVMQKVRIQKPSGPTLGYEVEPEKKGFGSALVSGFKGFWDMTTGDTKRALGYAFDRPDWVQEGMLSQMLGEAEKRQYNFVPKYDGVVETWREVYEKEGFFSALKSATGAAVESGAANTAATAYIFGTQVLTNLAMGALGVALTPASGGTGAVAAAASGAKALKGLKDIAKLILSSKGYVSNVAAIGVTGAMMIGEPMRRAIDEGVFDPEKSGEALLFGLASTGLEYGGFLAMRGAIGVRKGWNKLTDTELFKKIYGRAPVAGEIEATKSWAKKYLIPEAVGVLGGSVEEGGTEMGQDLLAMWYSNRSGADISFEEGWKDSWNAFWSAVPLGGGMRLAGSVPRIVGSIWQEGAEKRAYDRNGGVLAGEDAMRGSDMSAFNPAALAATQIFRTENGKSIVSYGGTTIEHDGDVNQAMMNLIAARKAGLEPIDKGENDANITVNDNNTEASIPFSEGGGIVTYKGENAKERLSELVDEHNDMASSPFMLTEGMTIEEEKKDGKTTYWVTFPNDPLSPNGAPFKRGVDNLHSRYATNPNGGFAAAYVQEIPVSVARAQARGVPMSAVESGQNVPGDVLFLKNTENPSGNGSRELTLFDRSRNVIYRVSVSARDSEGKRRVSLSAKTHLGKTLKLDDNVRNQVVEDGGQINLGAPTFGFSATRTETAGKESYHLDLDQAKAFAESIGATLNEENSTMEKVEFTTASGRRAVVRVVPPKGTLLVEYNGDVVEVRSGVFDLADMDNFQDTGRPVFGLFGYDFEDVTGSSENPVIRRVWKNANGQNRVTLLYYNQNGELVGKSDNLMPEEETEEMTEEEVNMEITFDMLSDIFPTRFRRGYAIKSADGDGAANYLDDNGEYTSDPSEAALFDRATAEALVTSEESAGRLVVPVSYYEFFGADEDGNIDYNDRIFEIGDTENDEISSDFKNQVIIKGQDVLLAFGAFAQEVEDLSQTLSDENLEASFNARGEDPIASLTDEELNTLRNVTEVSVDEVDDLDLDLSNEDFTLEDETNSQDPRAPKHALAPRVTPTDSQNLRRSQMLDTEGFNLLQEVIAQEKARRDFIARLRGKTPEPVEEGNNRLLELAGKWNTMTDNEKLEELRNIIVRYYFLSTPLYRGKDSGGKQQSFSLRLAEFIGKLQEDRSISPNWKYSFQEAMIIPQVQKRLSRNLLGYIGYEKGRRVILPAESDKTTGETVYGFVRITNKPGDLFVKNARGENIYYTITTEENEATLFDTKTEDVYKGVYDNLRLLNGKKQITDFAYRVNYKKTRNQNKRQWDIKSFSADLKIPEGVIQTTSLKSISDTHSQSPLDDLGKHLDKIEEDAVRKIFDNHLGISSNESELTEGVLKKIEEFKKKFGLEVAISKNITLGEAKLRLREEFFKHYKRDGDISYSAQELPQEIEGNKEEVIDQKEKEAIRERHILREMVDVFNRKLMGNVKNNNTPIQRKFTSSVVIDLRGNSYAGTIYTITYDDGTSEGKRVISETNFNEAKEKAYRLFFEKYLDYFTKLGRKLQGNGNFGMSLRNERSETVVDFTRVENGEVRTDVIRKENRSTIDFIGYVSGIAMNSFFQAAGRSQHPDIASGNNRPLFQKLYRDAVLRILENRLNKTDFKLRRYANGRGAATAKIFYEPSTTETLVPSSVIEISNNVRGLFGGEVFAGDKVNTLRVGNPTNIEHFGNPFSHISGDTSAIFKVNNVKEAVDFFEKWITGKWSSDVILFNLFWKSNVGRNDIMRAYDKFARLFNFSRKDYTFDDNFEFASFGNDVLSERAKEVKNRVARYLDERRNWILEQINSGNLDGKTLVYYTKKIPQPSGYPRGVTEYSDQYPSHAYILQRLVNNRRGEQTQRVKLEPQLLRTYNILGSNKNLFNDLSDIIDNVDMLLRWSSVRASTLAGVEEGTPEANLQGFHNHSGGARGADTAWDHIGRRFGVETTNWYPSNANKPTDLGRFELDNVYRPLTDKEEAEGLEKAKTAWDKIRPPRLWARETKEQTFTRRLWARNWFQVKNAEKIFAVGALTGLNSANASVVKGGTASAVQMAMDNGQKSIYFYNQSADEGVDVGWYEYSYADHRFKRMSVLPVLSEKFAGIGTREINGNGWAAIADVYRNTVYQRGRDETPTTPSEPVSTALQETPAFDFYKAYFGTQPVENDNIDEFFAQQMNNVEDLSSNSVFDLFEGCCKRGDFQIRFVRVGENGNNQLYFLSEAAKNNFHTNIEKVIEKTYTVDQVKNQNIENKGELVPVYILTENGLPSIVEANFRDFIVRLWNINTSNNSTYQLINEVDMVRELYQQIASINPDSISIPKNKDASVWNWKQPSKRSSNDTQDISPWLSNFVSVPEGIVYGNNTYDSVEAAYQAEKVDYCRGLTSEQKIATKRRFAKGEDWGLYGGLAKLKGRDLEKGTLYRFDSAEWEKNKERILGELVEQKFLKNQEFQDRLLRTGMRYIVEGHAGNKEWGAVWTGTRWDGENKMGKILMGIRQRLAQERVRSFGGRFVPSTLFRSTSESLRKQREAFSEAVSKSPGAPDTLASFRFFDSREGMPKLYEDTGLMSPDGARARSIEDELVAHYGESILTQVASGQIVILENQEAARNFWNRRRQDPIYSADGVFQGFCDRNGVIYLVRDGIRDGDVHKVVVHEKGVHAGFLGFTRSRDFQSILQYLRDHIGDTTLEGLAIKRAFERAYRMTKDPDEVWIETLAYLCEENADNQYNIIQRFIATVKKWLFEHGILDVSRFSVDDFVIFAQAAARAPLRQVEMERYDALASTVGNIGLRRMIENGIISGQNARMLSEMIGNAELFLNNQLYIGNDIFTDNIHSKFRKVFPELDYTRSDISKGFQFTYRINDGEISENFRKEIIKKTNRDRKYMLPEVYNNAKLFLIYPELKNVKVMLNDGGDTYFSPSSNTIYVGKTGISNRIKNFNSETVLLDILSYDFEHEIFHAIELIEGYTFGDNEKMYDNFIKNNGINILEDYIENIKIENSRWNELQFFNIFSNLSGIEKLEMSRSIMREFFESIDYTNFNKDFEKLFITIKNIDQDFFNKMINNSSLLSRYIRLFYSKYDRYNRISTLLKKLKNSKNSEEIRKYSAGEILADRSKNNYLTEGSENGDVKASVDINLKERLNGELKDIILEEIFLADDLRTISEKLGISLESTDSRNRITGTTNTTEEGTDVSNIDSKTAVDEQLYVKTQSIRDDILQDSEFARILETIDTLKNSHPEIYAEIEQQDGDNLFAAMFSALMNKQDTLRDHVLSSLLLRAKDFLHKVTERKEFFGQPRERTNLSSENMKAMASAISGVPRSETLSSTATTPEEAFAVQTNSILLEQMALPPRNTFLEYVQEEINSMLDLVEGNFSYGVEVIDGVETPVIYENGQPAHILKGVAPAHAQGAVEHLVFRGSVTENKRPSDTEQEDPFWYNKLLKPLHALAPQDFSNVQAKLDPGFVDKVLNALPAHIRERIEIHSNPTDPRTRELLLKHNSHGIFLPMSAARKTIHIRDFNISKEQFIRAVSEEIGHYSWQLFGNSQMDKIVNDIYDELRLIIEKELKNYLPKGGVFTTFDKLNLINEFFSKYGVNFLNNKEVNDLFGNESFSERFKNKYNIESINNLRKQILDEVGVIATNMNVAVFTDPNSTNEDFKEFFEQLLITLMSPAHGKAVVASFPRGDGRVTEIRVNDWGQMRRIRPKTAEAAIRQKIAEIVNQQPSDFGKLLVMWRFDNLPFNFYSPQWFVNFLGRFIDFVSFGALRNSAEWIRIPGGFTGDTVVGKDVSILLSRAYQSIYSDYGLRMKKEYVNMTKFADYLRRNNLNPDLVDKAKGYVAFMQENGLDDKKMLEMAREADVFMQEGVRRIEDNVLRIRQEFMNTLNSLRLWGARYNLTSDAMRKIEKEVNDVMKNFKQNYSHRAYRAYTPEDRANINEMQQYLMEDNPVNFLSNKLAEANRKKAEAKLELEKSQKTPDDYTKYRKATKEADHLQYIYNRLAGLQEYASAVVTGTAKRIDNELDIDLSEIVGMGSNYAQQTHELMKKIVEKVAYKNLETRKNKQDKQHSRFNVIAGVMRRKFDEKNSWERGYMTFLDEIKNPMESVLLSLDQQEKILNKLAFNRILGEKILETGMGYFKLDPDKVLSPGMTKIGFGEKGTFLSFLGLDTFFDKAFEKEYDVASKMTDNAVWARYFAMTRANLTVYNPKLAISNYISNIGVGFATGHLFRMANVIGGAPIIRDDFLKRFKGREANPNAFQKQILDELVRYQVIGGSSSSTEMKIYTHNNHEKLISWLTSTLERVTPLSQAGKFSMDNFLFNLLEKAREIYGYGDEWLKIIAYLNNREMAMAKYEAEFDSSDPNYQRNVREAAAKDAANLTQLEMTTWELSPMMIRQLAGSSMRILTPDFIMHNFQILRMTTVALGRLMEIGSEIKRVSSIQNRTPAQDKYLALLGFEMARRGAGTVVGAAMLGTLILCPAYLIPYLATVFVPGLFGGGDDGRPDDENRHSFTTAEHTGAQMLLNSLMDATNLWAPAYRKDKYTFLATNHQRQDAAQTLFAPPPATETPTLAQYGINQAKMIIDLGSDNILGQVYNGLRGKDRYGQQVGFMKAFKELAARGVVPEAINQAAFTGSALTNWALEGEVKGRTINEMLIGKPARQQLAHKSWELVGASVREYDIRDMASSRAYEIKQGIGNAQNPVRRDFIEDVVNNPNMSDSTIVSKIERMMKSNEQRMGRAAYAVNGLRNWGLSDNEIIKYFNKGRNAPGTTILSEADARKIVEGKNIYDYHILTALQEKRDTFAGKLGDDSKYTREQRQRIVDTIDRFMAKYKEMMGEGAYTPSGRKTPRRRDSEQPTGNPRYNKGTNSGSPVVRQNVVATGEGNLVINGVYDGDTFKGTRRGQLFSYRVANMDAREMGQEGGTRDRAAMMSLIAGSDNVRLKPIMRDKYGRIVVEAYVGDKLLAEEMIGRGNAREYFTDRNVNDPEMVARLRAATERARVAGLTPTGQTAEQFRRENGG